MPANPRDPRPAPPLHTALVVCDTPEYQEEIERALVQIEFKVINVDADSVDFTPALRKFKPTAVFVAVSDPDPEMLTALRAVSDELRYSLIWYGDASELSAESAEALGAHGILFHPADLDQVATVLQLAAARAETLRELKTTIAKLQEDLETRKFVDRARGIIMQQMSLTEEEAYHLLRRESRRQRKPMKEVAQADIMSQGILAGMSRGTGFGAAPVPGEETYAGTRGAAPAEDEFDDERDDTG
jgi:response regulator NasT